MKPKQLLKLLRQPIDVFGWVNTTPDDGNYIKLVKSDVIQIAKNTHDDIDINAHVNDGRIFLN